MIEQKHNLVYQTDSGQELPYDFFRPEGPGIFPAVVVIHGGGWISGDRSMMTEVGVSLASQGYAAYCPNYRLAPLHPYPAAVHDMQAFVRTIRSWAQEHQIDPTRVAALGNSAGGHLAAMLGLVDRPVDGLSSRVNAAVAISPITDLCSPRDQHLPVAWAFLEQFMGCSFLDEPETWQEASPIHHVGPHSAPFLILHGTADDIVPISQSVRLHEAIESAGGASQLVELPGEGHSFTYSGWTRIESCFLDFLAERLKDEHIA